MVETFLSELNKSQYEAVTNTEGPNLVIAGAGSGKTRVLTYRIAYLLSKNVPASRILALTFTNKAADEMKERIAGLVGYDKARHLWMGTFHSIFAKILRIEAERLGYNSNYTIYDADDTKSLLKKIIKDRKLDIDKYKPAEIYARISRAKNNLITPKDYLDNATIINNDIRIGKPEICNIYLSYARYCHKNNAMDFDDLLMNTNILFRDNKDILEKYQNKFDYILVDEYQDTNYSQYLILKKLADKHKNICVVGDDAQSIYSFRGAKIENIFNFKKDYSNCKIFKLEKNYRSTKSILNAANSIIAKNKKQISKNIWSDNAEGKKPKLIKAITDTEEGYIVANLIIDFINNHKYNYSDHAILYRTNAQSRIFEEFFRKKNIPYKIYGGISFYMRKEIKDLLAYLKTIINPADNESLKRIINYPGRGIGKTTIEKLEQISDENNISLWDVLNRIDEIKSIRMSTKESISEFVDFINGYIEIAHKTDAYQLSYSVAKESKILHNLFNEKTPESLSKYENIQELLNSIRDFSENLIEEEGKSLVTIYDFVERVSLITDQDVDDKDNNDRVHLMTIHSAKGLEFKNVFIVGLEEDLFPSYMSTSSPDEIEEERRLFYVALTRAQENVILSYSSSRYKWGKLTYSEPSRFINEIDARYLDMPIDYKFKYRPELIENKTDNKSNVSKKQGTPHTGEKNMAPEENFVPDNFEKIMPGMKVLHQKFGQGKVIQLEGKYPNTKATVYFVNTGQKTLLLKYAKLKIIS
ncbi:MAG: 3'-5' exonuclease [Marinilabiliales bacterium]